MSKITNDGLTPSGTGCSLWLYSYGNGERQRVTYRHLLQFLISSALIAYRAYPLQQHEYVSTSWIFMILRVN